MVFTQLQILMMIILQSGQMVYEVIRVEEGIPLFIEDYLNRLEKTITLSGLKIIFESS